MIELLHTHIYYMLASVTLGFMLYAFISVNFFKDRLMWLIFYFGGVGRRILFVWLKNHIQKHSNIQMQTILGTQAHTLTHTNPLSKPPKQKINHINRSFCW